MIGNVWENFVDYFEVMENNTRNNGKLKRLPWVRLECSKKGFHFTDTKIYDKLPIKFRNATTLNNFKIVYKHFKF